MPTRLLAVLLASLMLAGCAEDGTYPVSGEECAPEDAVLDLDAADCAVTPPTGSGTF